MCKDGRGWTDVLRGCVSSKDDASEVQQKEDFHVLYNQVFEVQETDEVKAKNYDERTNVWKANSQPGIINVVHGAQIAT